ncbi:MAG: MFS transporter [Cyanobacteria bacterium SIG31]|nr:MFS transporter [Cyanobacteria bacterium SIG31]
MKNKGFILHFSLILLGVLFYFVANFQRIAVPGAIFDILEQELSVGAPQITAFGAIFMYIYAFTQLLNGVFVDRYGGYRVMFAGSIIMGLGCLIFPLSSNLVVMYFSRALLGLGGSMFYLSLIKELGNLFSEKDFGIALSVMLFIGYAGGIAANAPFVFAMKYIAWRDILLIIAGVVLVSAIAYLFILPKAQLKNINKGVTLRALPFRLVLHKKHNRNLYSFACCNFGISYVIQTVIGKKFLEDFCSMTSGKAATVLSVMAIIAAVFNIINASLCKMCHNHRVLFLKIASIITFVSLFIICLLIWFDVKSMLIPVIFCVLAGNASLSSLLVPVLHMTNSKMTSGTAVSILNFGFFMMVGFLGTLTGYVLNVFEPERINNTLVYNNNSYLLLFFIFLILSVYEVYKAGKLSNKY